MEALAPKAAAIRGTKRRLTPDNPVFASLFGLVMGFIRGFYQVLRTHLRPQPRHTDTDRNLTPVFQPVHGRLGNALAQSLGQHHGLIRGRLAQEHHKFVAAVTAKQVGLPDPLLQDSRHLPHGFITLQVAQGVVDQLEIIDVQKKQR